MLALLQRQKHQVQAADSGEQAISLASRESFDLVVSDLGLPDMSGLEMMRNLRDRFGLRGIAISGFGMDEDVALSKAAGFVRHLTKPVRFEWLLKVIGELENP
jgi:CheY-like chemotaxis protein